MGFQPKDLPSGTSSGPNCAALYNHLGAGTIPDAQATPHRLHEVPGGEGDPGMTTLKLPSEATCGRLLPLRPSALPHILMCIQAPRV